MSPFSPLFLLLFSSAASSTTAFPYLLSSAGVGKTSLVHLICHGEVLTNPSSTVGCNVEVKVLVYGTIQYIIIQSVYIRYEPHLHVLLSFCSSCMSTVALSLLLLPASLWSSGMWEELCHMREDDQSSINKPTICWCCVYMYVCM